MMFSSLISGVWCELVEKTHIINLKENLVISSLGDNIT